MSQRFLQEQYGYYEPSFFRMHLNITENLKHIDKLLPSSFSTFIHEYIHFIQDLTTIYGLGNIYNTVQFIRYSTNQIYNEGQSFHVPIKPDSSTFNGSMIGFNEEMEKITFGSTKGYTNVRLLKCEKNNVPITEHLGMNKIPVINLKVDIKGYGVYFYGFGASCIMESMAYILEKRLSNIDDGLSDFPYNSAKIVANSIYKRFASSELRLLALCDISLNSSNPGNTFVKLLKEWKEKKFMPHDVSELYDDFYKRQYMLHEETPMRVTNNMVKYYNQLENYVGHVRESLHQYFRPENTKATDEFTIRMNLLNQWIDEVLNSTLKWRKEHPHFIVEIAQKGIGTTNKPFVDLYNEFGLPFCTNDNNEACFYHRNIQTAELQLDTFLAVGQIFRLMHGNTGVCKLFDYCHKCQKGKTGDVQVNQKCYSPWLRDMDERLCPYALVWRHWNLTGRRPILPIY
jgi:hypothetical protein